MHVLDENSQYKVKTMVQCNNDATYPLIETIEGI